MGINMQEYDNEWVNEGINDSGKPEDQKHYQGLIQPIELMQELLSHKEFWSNMPIGQVIKMGNLVRKTKRNMKLIKSFSIGIFMADRWLNETKSSKITLSNRGDYINIDLDQEKKYNLQY